MNLHAGRKAKASVAYASARAYLSAGMALPGRTELGQPGTELTFNLWLERAECEFLSGNFDEAERFASPSCCSAGYRSSTWRPATT